MSATTKDAPTKNRRRPARGGSGPETTDEQNAEKGFQASEQLTDALQAVLVDLIELSIQGKQAHWNVVGKNFRDTHLQLDEIIDAAREFSDEVAERMRALHALPDGRSDTIAETTTLPEFPQGEVDTSEVIDLITERLDATVGTVREVHDDGSATIYTGTSPHGQGHDTAFSMIASAQTGIPMDRITLVWGDTDRVPKGGGTMGSRSLQQGGAAVNQAAIELGDPLDHRRQTQRSQVWDRTAHIAQDASPIAALPIRMHAEATEVRHVAGIVDLFTLPTRRVDHRDVRKRLQQRHHELRC